MKNLDKLIKLAKVYEQSKQYNLADETINKIKITLAQQTYKTNAGLTVTKPTPQQTNKQLNYGKDANGKDIAYNDSGNIYQLDAQGKPIIPTTPTQPTQPQIVRTSVSTTPYGQINLGYDAQGKTYIMTPDNKLVQFDEGNLQRFSYSPPNTTQQQSQKSNQNQTTGPDPKDPLYRYKVNHYGQEIQNQDQNNMNRIVDSLWRKYDYEADALATPLNTKNEKTLSLQQLRNNFLNRNNIKNLISQIDLESYNELISVLDNIDKDLINTQGTSRQQEINNIYTRLILDYKDYVTNNKKFWYESSLYGSSSKLQDNLNELYNAFNTNQDYADDFKDIAPHLTQFKKQQQRINAELRKQEQ
jgi:hypothetical protein